ncbi:MAG: hypothetical protein ABWY56_12045, partial [Propionibacteriaceae bacterium]
SPSDVSDLMDLGAALGDAQQRAAGADLRRFSKERHTMLEALTRQAVQLAADRGHSATEATRQEVTQTLQAALSDPSVAELVRAGRVIQPASYGGFGPMDLFGAGLSPEAGKAEPAEEDAASEPPEQVEEPDQPESEEDPARVEAETAVREAEQAATEARDAAAEAERAAEEATTRADELADQVEELRKQLEDAETAEREAGEAARAARKQHQQAQKAAGAAEEQLAAAQQALADLPS